MEQSQINTENPDALCRCDNCEAEYAARDLDYISDVELRLDAGSVVPAGQCPDCGALAYLVKQPVKMHEYAFDVKLFAVVRLNAPDLDAARRALATVLDAAEPTDGWIDGYNSEAENVRITEVSLDTDDEDRPDRIEPFEIDGEEQEG